MVMRFNYIKVGKRMLKWLLITSITLVSTTLLMFVSAYIAIFEETANFYGVSIDKVVMLSYTFNIFYLIISPIIFPFFKKHFSIIVKVATVLTAIGCVGRYLAEKDYNLALWMSVLVGIAHIPIITAPYGLLALFQPNKRGYAASIPLFVPSLGINFCILYGMSYIVDQSSISVGQRNRSISWLNFIIGLVGAVSALLTILFMNMLSRQIQQHNEKSEDAQNARSIISSLRNEFKNFKEFFITSLCWGTILGINWTYGAMFGVFLNGTGLTHKDIALIGLCANLSSAVFSNLGIWISNRCRFSNSSIIFYLNVLGFMASVFIQASSCLPQPIFHDKTALILVIIVLRAGFSSFVSLSLIQLSKFGSSVLVSSVFFYIANGVNLGSTYLVTIVENPISLGFMSLLVWLCVFTVFLVRKTFDRKVQMIQVSNDESIKVSSKEEYEMDSVVGHKVMPQKI